MLLKDCFYRLLVLALAGFLWQGAWQGSHKEWASMLVQAFKRAPGATSQRHHPKIRLAGPHPLGWNVSLFCVCHHIHG